MKMITIGSRRSQLAQTQSKLVRQMLLTAWPELEVKIELIDTRGDLNRHDPLPEIGGKGLFTLELEEALRERRIDLAVHSLKDLPIEDSPGLKIAAIPERAAVGDMFLCRTASHLEDLPAGAVVGTSSLRRAAQILSLCPDLQIKNIRGNVDTRLRKLDDPDQGYEAIILAQAGLQRMGQAQLEHAHPIPTDQVLPAPGQGALAVQGRKNDPEVDRYLQVVEHQATRFAVTAERAFLAGLGGGCSLPVGALAHLIEKGQLHLKALVAHPEGQSIIVVEGDGPIESAEQLGQQLANKAIAQGASDLVNPLNQT